MPLTADDLKQIKSVIETVVGPQFDVIRQDIHDLTSSTKLQFDQMYDALGEVPAIKDVVKDHGFRISRLEQQMR